MSGAVTLRRVKADTYQTVGVLTWPGGSCLVLEDPPRNVKIPKETCIKPGSYVLKRTWSNKFNKYCAEVKMTGGFEFSGIRLHAGATAKDSWGCLLLVDHRKYDMKQKPFLHFDYAASKAVVTQFERWFNSLPDSVEYPLVITEDPEVQQVRAALSK